MSIEEYINPNILKSVIIGCDEVGYGSWCGPVVVGAVKAPKDWHMEGLNDSKKLSKPQRNKIKNRLTELINNGQISFHIAERSNTVIDQIGIAKALKDCYVECFKELYSDDCLIVCDGILKFDNEEVNDYNKTSLIKADQKISQVMAASILAKTYRDAQMEEYHNKYPKYGWNSNSGYGAKIHKEALDKYGLTPLHRLSYKPMKDINK